MTCWVGAGTCGVSRRKGLPLESRGWVPPALKSSFATALICTTRRRIPKIASADQKPFRRRFDPAWVQACVVYRDEKAFPESRPRSPRRIQKVCPLPFPRRVLLKLVNV